MEKNRESGKEEEWTAKGKKKQKTKGQLLRVWVCLWMDMCLTEGISAFVCLCERPVEKLQSVWA